MPVLKFFCTCKSTIIASALGKYWCTYSYKHIPLCSVYIELIQQVQYQLQKINICFLFQSALIQFSIIENTLCVYFANINGDNTIQGKGKPPFSHMTFFYQHTQKLITENCLLYVWKA